MHSTHTTLNLVEGLTLFLTFNLTLLHNSFRKYINFSEVKMFKQHKING